MRIPKIIILVLALSIALCLYKGTSVNCSAENQMEISSENTVISKAFCNVEKTELIIKNGANDIYGMLYKPVIEGSFPVVIMGHGYNSSFMEWQWECQYFAERGIAAYAYDFCGGSTQSKSTGKTTDMTIYSEKSDVLAVFHEFSEMENIEKIYLMGRSQGGFATALAAEELGENAAAMILYFPALCIPDDWRSNYPEGSEIPESLIFWDMELGKDFIETAREMDVFQEIGNYSNPVLIFHGTDDAVVPVSYSEQASEKYPNVTLVKMKGEGHGFSPETAEKAMEQAFLFMCEN